MKKGIEPAKRRHHIVPRHYLRGFCEKPSSDFLWGYQKGARQPIRASISDFAVRRDFYSRRRPDGTLDTNSVEDFLADKIEAPTAVVLRKIRLKLAITGAEKGQLARYLAVLLRRVPAHKERLLELAPGVIDALQNELLSEWEQAARDNSALAEAVSQRSAELVRYLDECRNWQEVPDWIFLPLIQPRLAQVLSAMTWRFLIAPLGFSYLTSDNPFFFHTGLGIGRPESEVTFPISKDVALWASWRSYLPQAYDIASPEAVQEINRRTVASATRWVFAHQEAEGITELVNSKIGGFTRLV